MKKYLHFSRFLVLLVGLLTISANSIWGDTKTVTLSDGSSSNNVNTWSIANVITITQAFGTTPTEKTQTPPNSSYISAPRWYTYNDITFTPASGITISSIVVTATTSDYANALAKSSTIAEREESSSTTNFNVIITPTDGKSPFVITMGAQCRLSAILVTFGSSGGVTYTDYLTECVSCNDPSTALEFTGIPSGEQDMGSASSLNIPFGTEGGNGEEITYKVSPETGVELDSENKTLTFTDAGPYTLTATQPIKMDAVKGNQCGATINATITITKNPVFGTATIDKTAFDVTCGDTTSMDSKATITLGENYNLTKAITVTASDGFLVSTNKSDKTKYAQTITLTPTASGDNAGKITGNVYVRAYAASASEAKLDGTITFTGTEITTQTLDLSANVTCPKYTLTFVDRGATDTTVTQYAGTDVAEPTAPTGVCTEPINYVFDGWAEASVAEGSTSYTKVTFPYTMPNNNTTKLYAVYKYVGAVSNEYKQITTAAEIISGADYLIVGKNSANGTTHKAFSTEASSTAGQYTAVKVSPSSAVITNTDTKLIWRIDVNGTNYTLYNAAANKYANINSGALSLAKTATPYTLSVSSSVFSFKTTDGTNNAYLSYYNSNSIFNAYSNANTINVYKRQNSYAYTSDPACGPHIGLMGDVRITSAKGVRVDAYTKITISGTNLNKNTGGDGGTATAVSIKAESNNANFKIKRWGTTGDGTASSFTLNTGISDATYTDSLCITYTPTAFNAFDTATITLTAYKYGGNTAYATKTITVLGHSLPEQFVIAAKGTDGWVALPNTLANNSSATVPNVEDINADVDDSNNPAKLTTAPSNVIYKAAARGDSYKNNSQTGLRFTVDGGQFLQASKNETKVWLSTTDSQDMQSWTLRTEDFTDYVVRLDSGSRYNRSLSYYKDATTERIGHYTTNTAIRFLPFDTECTRLLAPANLKVTQVKSSAITLAWDAVAGAIGYKYSIDGGTNWTKMGNVLTYTITGLKAETPYTIWVKGVVPVGDTDCSYYGTVSATTTNCDDVPQNISYTSDVNSITLSWTMESTTATVRVYSDDAGTTQVGSDHTGATSPYTIKGLAKATTYYVKILADGSCPSALVEVSTERPQLDVVEWKTDGIDVAINTNEKISVVLENQVTKGSGTGIVADDLFFSKYFEGSGSLKLLGIFNGTNTDIDLKNYTLLKGSNGDGTSGTEFDLSQLGTIKQGQEIILFAEPTVKESPYECSQTFLADKKTKYGENENPRWILCDNNSHNGITFPALNFSGDDPLILRKNGVNIDVWGVSEKTTAPSALTICTGRSDECWVADNVPNMDYGKTAEDFGGTIPDGVNIDDEYITAYTARIIMFRSNSVQSGANAVANNTSTFATFSTEWQVRQVCRKGDDGDLTCAAYTELGVFDYNGYYTTYDSLVSVEFDNSKRNPDGTLTIEIPRMDTLACKGLKIVAADSLGNVLTTKEYKVPILITENATTNSTKYFRFGGDTCKNCDVVVRNNATLTKAADGKDQVRDVMVYEGSSLKVNGETSFTVNSLSLRRKEDAVSTVDVAGTLTFSNTSGKPVYLDLRITAENWHWFTLPYDCAIADVTWSNGQPAKYGTEWFLMDYDGARRATGVDSGNWKEYEGTTIAAGQGFIIGIKGDGNDKHAYELRFPMAKEVITNDGTDKKVEVYAYGAGTEARPNHKGWNLVGNPYLNYYQKGNINSFNGLRLGLLDYDTDTGWWSVSATDNSNPYIVIPQDFGWSAYKQVLVSSQDLLPFTSYFIQVGKDKGYDDGQKCEVQFDKDQRGKSPKAALMKSAAEGVEEEPVITGIVLRNAKGEEDETSLVIAERFGSSYEMGADFFKWFGDYYKYYTLPVLYSIGDDGGKRAFNAVNEEGAKQSIPLGMYAARDGQYTFSLNTRSDLSRVDKVWLYDAENGRYTDLLREDYTFATTRTEGSGRFFLSVMLKEEEITTSAANARYGDLTLYADKQTLVVRGLPEAAEVWVYDPSGKLLHHEQTRHYERQYEVPQQGTYLVRVESQDGGVTLRGVCR